jgi:PAS domain S-box-containing protein
VKLQLSERWQRRLGSSYEIRIRVTLGLMFLLIIVANLNSLRFFSQSAAFQTETIKYKAVDNLDRIARLLKDSPAERLHSAQFRDLIHLAGFSQVFLVETELLQHDGADGSRYTDQATLRNLREAYNRNKEIAGSSKGSLPATVSEVYDGADGLAARTAAFHFTSEKGEQLTLLATLPATIEGNLARFSRLNTLFQILSIAAAFTIAVLLLKITLKPYRQIKSQALAAEVARTDQPEAVDFAVQAFQKVISELRHKEAVLERLYAQQKDRAKSLERYNEYILSSMPSAVISCDNEGSVTRFNRAAETILNVNSATAIGKNFHYALAEYPALAKLIDAALAKGREASFPEIELPLADGRRLWLGLNCSLLRDTDASVKGAMILFSDLTDLKSLEAEIAIKDQMAALGEMSAGLAHQLRNSLAAVVGFAQLLRKLTFGSDQVPEIVTNILNEAQATEEMLTLFLKLSRHDEVDLREVEFSQIQQIVETHFGREILAGDVNLSFAVDSNLPALTCDPVLIANALINLVQNSVEASARGSLVKIRAYSRDFDGSTEIKVIDQGRGIAPAEIDRIFLPFFTSGKTTGTGLGLSLVRKWVMCHGGDISCESKPDHGTTFTIRLPNRTPVTNSGEDSGKISLAKV